MGPICNLNSNRIKQGAARDHILSWIKNAKTGARAEVEREEGAPSQRKPEAEGLSIFLPLGRAGPRPSPELLLPHWDLRFLLTSESKAKAGSGRKCGQARPEGSSSGIGIPEKVLSYPVCPRAARAPHHPHKGKHKPPGPFGGQLGGPKAFEQLKQRPLNRFSEVLLRTRPLGQAAGSLG